MREKEFPAIALLTSKGRDPFTTFSRAAGDRSFGIVPVDRPLQLFHGRRAIALFCIVPVDRP
ncbi:MULTISPECIES: hypothetical protein [unclassified Microcoleus]|uniref:hypothetical protein n=1 Tax=unclassified Microcoleus TaxID=2642155 RepID=UPI002FD0B0B8